MNRVSLIIVAASVCLSIAVLILQGRRPETAVEEQAAIRGRESQRSASKGSAGPNERASSRAAAGKPSTGAPRRAADRKAFQTADSDASEELRDPASGAEAVIVGKSFGGAGVQIGERAVPSLDGSPSVAGGANSDAEGGGERGGNSHSARAEDKHDAKSANSPAEPHAEAAPVTAAEDTTPDADGVVLDLPLDGSEDPKHGLAPSVSDGVSFDGEGAYFAADAQLAIPRGGNIAGEGGTITFWIKPDWAGRDPINVSFIQLREPNAWANRLQIFKNGTAVRFIFTPDEGTESGAAGDISAWQPGDWHMVTATWGDGVASLYVDGNLVGSQEYAGEFRVSPTTPLLVGSDYKPNYRNDYGAAGGAMSGVKVYNRPLTPDEVFEATAQVPS